jgi:hypothetical protein
VKVIVNTLENGQDIFRVLDNEPVFFLKPALGAGGTLFMIANQAENVKAVALKKRAQTRKKARTGRYSHGERRRDGVFLTGFCKQFINRLKIKWDCIALSRRIVYNTR